jgi:hypothetical protein
MKVDTSLRTVEPLQAVKKHPRAAALGGAITALLLGVMGTAIVGPVVGVLMAVIGAAIGAPGAAHMADDAAQAERPV